MRLIPGELVYGVAPELLQYCAKELRWHDGFEKSSVCECLGASEKEVEPVLSAFIRDGFIVELKDGTYSSTDKMSRLALATISHGLIRADAQKLLDEVVKRAQEINSGKRICDGGVSKLAVFGSFLDERTTTLGDLDVAYEWKRGIGHPQAKRIPRLRKVLAAAHPLISVHEMSEITHGNWPYRIVYDEAIGELPLSNL